MDILLYYVENYWVFHGSDLIPLNILVNYNCTIDRQAAIQVNYTIMG